jgi:glycerophosphoryl diester phosphodiesterase
MMQIISHRGLWQNDTDKNTLSSFKKSIENGFGIETDIRDHNDELVISHDLPSLNSNLITLNQFLELYSNNKCDLTLALNIKADGLSDKLKISLQSFNIKNYFVFDMSIPDLLSYKKKSITFYTRQSEYESEPSLYNESNGIWLDAFYSNWIDLKTLKLHHGNNKKICIVSPELHGRDYYLEWEKYKKISTEHPDIDITLCTDKPLEARSYFE